MRKRRIENSLSRVFAQKPPFHVAAHDNAQRSVKLGLVSQRKQLFFAQLLERKHSLFVRRELGSNLFPAEFLVQEPSEEDKKRSSNDSEQDRNPTRQARIG